ncbi:MAG: type IV secretory system conjugative DNA transfer family protein [Thiolinea sp.]
MADHSPAKFVLTLPFKIMWKVAVFLFKGKILRKEEGATFGRRWEYGLYLNARNRGLLLDGDSLKLSENESFQNVCCIARVGAGKTSRYIIPNVLARANKQCSLIINDPKGEVYSATSNYMRSKGFEVLVLNVEDPEHSCGFNPLWDAHTPIELDQIAEILVKCGSSGNDKDSFWEKGATRFVSVFLQCLKNAEQDNPHYNTLTNLYYLFQNFGSDGSKLDSWMARYTIDPDDPSDKRLWNEWKGVLTGNEEGVQSFVLNAITALKAMSNPNLARLTARSDFSLEDIRRRKTIIYVITPPQLMSYYAFFISLFFRSVFNACMRQLPDKKTLPLYVLYDEFGHSTIPNFVETINTIRAYKVSISIVLQSIAQLDSKYGRANARAILGGFATYLSYAGSDPDTASFFERIIGKKRITQHPDDIEKYVEHYREQNLINANEVRTMKDNQVLIVTKNRDPVLLPSWGYYQIGRYKWMVRKGEYNPPAGEPFVLQYLKF